jgi:potassium channel subfamily K, other eukaryote
MTLIWDFVRTPNFAKAGKWVLALYIQVMCSASPGSGITRKQRSLVIITMVFLTYIALGALISSLMMNLTFINGLFFTIVTTLTIGFGDIVPITAAQRFVVCFYAVFGIIILSAGIRVTSEAVLEGLQVGYRRRVQDYKRRRRARKRERELVRRWRAAIEERLTERGLEVWTADNPASSSQHIVRPATLRRGASFTPQTMYLNTEALPQDELKAAAREAGVPPDKFIGRKFGRRARQHRVTHHHHDPDSQQPPPSRQQQSKEGERPARVPLEFSWTIDDGGTQEKTGRWGSEWWDRARQALRLANAGDDTYPREDSNGGMTYQEMTKTLEREERRSLYVKVCH